MGYSYNAAGTMATEKDANNNTESYTYDAYRRLISIPDLLGANFFSNSNSAYQGNVLLHELLLAYTNWSDAEIFSAFSAYGLSSPNKDTEDISAGLSTDCTSTPPSVTWWGQ
jgi:YD repeat-containing protein